MPVDRWQGIPDLKAALAALPDKLRARALRNALGAAGRVIRDEARSNAPVLQMSSPYRKPGTLRNAISVRTSKVSRAQGNVGVFVNVKPAPGAKYKKVTSKSVFFGKSTKRVLVRASQRGAKSPTDPYYWRWLEFGWTPASGPRTGAAGKAGRRARRQAVRAGAAPAVPGKRFLSAAATKLSQALQVFITKAGPAIAKLNKPKSTP